MSDMAQSTIDNLKPAQCDEFPSPNITNTPHDARNLFGG